MDPQLARDIALAAHGLHRALDEIRQMIDGDRSGEALRELLHHAHELVDVLAGLVRECDAEGAALRALRLADLLSSQLELLERELDGKPLH
ncbi:MAG TPA: hypothetical protein VMV45_01840 [Casimicrobiaceae bacterium]|nr:hypothetical protein [Casimicrobiaceae bacterium]